MPRPLPAIGPMASISRARAMAPAPLMQRSLLTIYTGPTRIWREALTTPSSPFLYTAANWTGASWYLEVYMASSSAKALARLYDLTLAAEVASSVITDDMSTDNLSTYARARSSALTLVDGHEYQVQFGVQDGGGGKALGAKLLAVSPGVTHAYVSAIVDGGDATLVQPTNWNAAHSNALLEGHVPLFSVALEIVF